jgi:MFS family permease
MPARAGGPIGRYYLSFNLYALGNGLVAVFLNLFFLSNYSYLAVLYFQLATYATAYVAYALSGYFLPKYSPKHLYLLGLVLSGLVLIDLLVVSGPLSNAFAFGILWGTAMGVFYAGNNPMMHDITRGEDRTSFVAMNNLFTGAVSLVAPVCAGALIQFSTFPGVERYLWDFAVACVVFLVAALVIVPVRYQTISIPRYSLVKTIRGPGRSYARFQLLFVVSQLFAIPVGIVLPIYVFQETGSYLLTGVFASYLIVLSVGANFAFRRGFRRDGWFAPAAVVGIVVSSLALFVGWDAPLNAFVVGGVYTVLATPLNNMVMVEFMQRIDRDPGVDRVVAWANREFSLGVGRVVVLGLMIVLATFFVRNTMNLVYLLPFFALYAIAYLGVVPRRTPPVPGVPGRA